MAGPTGDKRRPPAAPKGMNETTAHCIVSDAIEANGMVATTVEAIWAQRCVEWLLSFQFGRWMRTQGEEIGKRLTEDRISEETKN